MKVVVKGAEKEYEVKLFLKGYHGNCVELRAEGVDGEDWLLAHITNKGIALAEGVPESLGFPLTKITETVKVLEETV